MTLIIQEVYTALKEVGASEQTATNAAQAITGYEDRLYQLEREMDKRFNEVDTRFSQLDREMDKRFNEVGTRFNAVEVRFERIEASLRLFQWMMGFNLTLLLAVFILLLKTLL